MFGHNQLLDTFRVDRRDVFGMSESQIQLAITNSDQVIAKLTRMIRSANAQESLTSIAHARYMKLARKYRRAILADDQQLAASLSYQMKSLSDQAVQTLKAAFCASSLELLLSDHLEYRRQLIYASAGLKTGTG